MNAEDGNNRHSQGIDALEQNLYSRSPQQTAGISRGSMGAPAGMPVGLSDVPQDWGRIGGDDPDPGIRPFTKKLLSFALAFLVLSGAVAAFIYLRGTNIVSTDNVAITINHPLTVAGGEAFAYEVTIKNENNTDLQNASLKIEYPNGARNPLNITEAETRVVEQIGGLGAGMEIKKSKQAILFGEEKSKQTIKVTLEYRVAASNAIYEQSESFDVELGQAPVTMTVDSLKEVNAGQEVAFTVTIASNSNKILQNVMLKAEYPTGFTFKSAEPQAFADSSLWKVGDLQPGGKRTIKVRGVIEGQNGEERNVRFSVGLQSVRSTRQVDPVFFSTLQTVVISKPFISAELFLNSSPSGIYTTKSGQNIRADVVWQNTTQNKVNNLKIEAKLSGIILNKNSVTVEGGFYRSSDNTIVWDTSNDSSFAEVLPGAQGRKTFNFSVVDVDASTISTYTAPEMAISLNVFGQRVNESQVPEQITAQSNRQIKLWSELSLTPRIVYSVGPFTNIGPLPPKTEQETKYTVMLAVTNGVNAVRDVRVTAALPAYVQWLGAISPSDAQVTYNPTGGVIEWVVGDMKAGEGLTSAPRQIAFQIGFTPSLGQAGNVPVLVNDPTVSGADQFAGITVSQGKNDLTTKLSTDPKFRFGDDIVVR